MTEIARRLILTVVAAFVVGALSAATAHADNAPVNRPLTDNVRAELVQAGAVLTGRPAAEFSGLRQGKTYIAEDPTTGVQWAAAALRTTPQYYWAGVMLQDANSYMAVTKAGLPGATWIPTAVGFGPIPASQEACPVPEDVRDLWDWQAGKCYSPPTA
jgi:hypothetical protein